MVRLRVSIALFLFVSVCFLCSCADEDAVPPASVSQGDTDDAWLEAQLGAATEVRELIEIRDMIASRAAARHVTTEQVRQMANDASRANELLGFSSAEASMVMGRIDGALASLRATYPALDELMARAPRECEACGIERLAATWDRYLAVAGDAALEGAGTDDGAVRAPAREPLRCKMTQLIIGFGTCAVRSGGSLLVYSICSYAVFCSSCSGGVASMICP